MKSMKYQKVVLAKVVAAGVAVAKARAQKIKVVFLVVKSVSYALIM
jgi:hypothetical protein